MIFAKALASGGEGEVRQRSGEQGRAKGTKQIRGRRVPPKARAREPRERRPTTGGTGPSPPTPPTPQQQKGRYEPNTQGAPKPAPGGQRPLGQKGNWPSGQAGQTGQSPARVIALAGKGARAQRAIARACPRQGAMPMGAVPPITPKIPPAQKGGWSPKGRRQGTGSRRGAMPLGAVPLGNKRSWPKGREVSPRATTDISWAHV